MLVPHALAARQEGSPQPAACNQAIGWLPRPCVLPVARNCSKGPGVVVRHWCTSQSTEHVKGRMHGDGLASQPARG